MRPVSAFILAEHRCTALKLAQLFFQTCSRLSGDTSILGRKARFELQDLLAQPFAVRAAQLGIDALGACKGCQMFGALREIVPVASGWPMFLKNRSEQFEARLVMV